MNHKRRKVKSRRAGCLFCKFHKHQRAKDSEENRTLQDRKRGGVLQNAREFGEFFASQVPA